MRSLLLTAALLAAPAGATSLGLLPGEWQFVGRIVKAEMPGASPAMTEMMMKRPQIMRTCITPEQAQRDPRSIFQNGKGHCQYKNFSMAGGRLALAMRCEGGMSMTSSGTYTPASYNMLSVMVSTTPHGTMTMITDGAGKRLGPCPKK